MPRPEAVAGVVRPTRVPTTPRWLAPAPPLRSQGRDFCGALMSLCIDERATGDGGPTRAFHQSTHEIPCTLSITL